MITLKYVNSRETLHQNVLISLRKWNLIPCSTTGKILPWQNYLIHISVKEKKREKQTTIIKTK